MSYQREKIRRARINSVLSSLNMLSVKSVHHRRIHVKQNEEGLYCVKMNKSALPHDTTFLKYHLEIEIESEPKRAKTKSRKRSHSHQQGTSHQKKKKTKRRSKVPSLKKKRSFIGILGPHKSFKKLKIPR